MAGISTLLNPCAKATIMLGDRTLVPADRVIDLLSGTIAWGNAPVLRPTWKTSRADFETFFEDNANKNVIIVMHDDETFLLDIYVAQIVKMAVEGHVKTNHPFSPKDFAFNGRILFITDKLDRLGTPITCRCYFVNWPTAEASLATATK